VLGRVTDDGFRSSIMIDAAKTMLEWYKHKRMRKISV
jgi:hypothetical protein